MAGPCPKHWPARPSLSGTVPARLARGRTGAFALAIATGWAFGCGGAGGIAAAPEPPPPPTGLNEVERSAIEVFRQAAPSVVFITTVAVEQDVLRRNLTAIPRGTGSGVVWDDRGHIVTNFHVIRDADAARVTLADQSVWPAELVGYHSAKDLAVLRIAAPTEQLRALARGRSNDLLVGQSVFAIGNPFGLDQTLSTGVISGLDREIMSPAQRPIQGVIQTDAAINPGNSGGPLLDSRGNLIGINTALYSPSGAYAGIGFAVPVDTIDRIVTQLIAHGRVIRPGLGLRMDEAGLGHRLGVRGVLVVSIPPGSPALAAGIKPTRRDPATGQILLGDLIVAFDGEPVHSAIDIYRLLDRHEVGDTATLSLLRQSARFDVTMLLQAEADE